MAETLKDVRKALLDADVSYKVAKEFTDTVKTKALGQNVLTSVSPGQLMVKIVHDELALLMGGDKVEINLKGSPSIVLMSGLQGSGKTTFAAKLANYLHTKKGKSPLLVACDIYRPAAIDQLKVLGEQIGIPIAQSPDERHAVTRKLGAMKTSMLQDVEAGRSIEIDALVAAVVEIGAKVGVATPYTSALFGLTRLAGRVRRLY